MERQPNAERRHHLPRRRRRATAPDKSNTFKLLVASASTKSFFHLRCGKSDKSARWGATAQSQQDTFA